MEEIHPAEKEEVPKDWFRNMGEPVRFKDFEPLGGFAAEAANIGQQVKVITRYALSSEEPMFHRLVEGFEGVVMHAAQKAGASVNLRRANTVLLVIRPDNNAELWVDTASVSMQCRVKRAVKARSVIFDSDIADVTAMSFPLVNIGEQDKVLCLFREGWGFGFAFDFNPSGKLDLSWFSTSLGSLHRALRYRHLYDVVANPARLSALLNAGWFPFVEIITGEFPDLASHVESGFDLSELEAKMVASFDSDRLDHLLERWMTKPHFSSRSELLKEVVEAFTARRPASVIKIVLTEIEGVLNDAYKVAHNGQGAKIKDLLEFAKASAVDQAGSPDTLFFPAAFTCYLTEHTFADFDPRSQNGTAGSRHAVGHGAASQESYTMARALQAILTLDQLAFYT